MPTAQSRRVSRFTRSNLNIDTDRAVAFRRLQEALTQQAVRNENDLFPAYFQADTQALFTVGNIHFDSGRLGNALTRLIISEKHERDLWVAEQRYAAVVHRNKPVGYVCSDEEIREAMNWAIGAVLPVAVHVFVVSLTTGQDTYRRVTKIVRIGLKSLRCCWQCHAPFTTAARHAKYCAACRQAGVKRRPRSRASYMANRRIKNTFARFTKILEGRRRQPISEDVALRLALDPNRLRRFVEVLDDSGHRSDAQVVRALMRYHSSGRVKVLKVR